ncbi:hypothetical protein [Taibaiella soli]|uniref:Outer membrane protein beta-barrel domain-containing protein n=1 Tax=Taibaiella soli TaxID=1649169 RepID=A0A2W2BFH9_9BACT|nr:hypothetical protein [Taibaiella soli]PZF72206.1 hypothetical protein DN068_14845 [Taibaiella soli]
MKNVAITLILLMAGSIAYGQHTINISNTDSGKSGNADHTLTIGSDGIHITSYNKDEKRKKIELIFFMLDLGINNLQDKTNYNSPDAQAYLQVNQDQKNSNLFSLREGKSVNVNIYPVMLKFYALQTKNQKIIISSGFGIQSYDFRFNKPISYVNYTSPAVIMDTISFSKNKLGFYFLNIPLGVTFKTRLSEKLWGVYGFGITGGYRLSSWTKQISDERGKDKNHDSFNFQDFNACLTGEIGLDKHFRLYASYQLTNLYKNALDQHPFAIGIRFGGV